MTPPLVRDREATKERILQAAFDEFTTRGFAGARVDDIATRAGCNKALLYQYYGDKDALFRQVLHCKMARLAEMHLDPAHPEEAAAIAFDFHVQNPWLTRLMMWEALDVGTGAVANEDERREHWMRIVEMIRDAQGVGAVDPALDAEQVLFSLVSLVTMWFAAPQTARLITGEDPWTPQALQKRRAHVIEMARRMLEVR
jgi:AcrR family transcriptional regulator